MGVEEESSSVGEAELALSGPGVVSRPALWERMGSTGVTVVTAPAGSGKTVLLRSWIGEAGLAAHTAWVPVGRDERDPQRFWLSVVDALRRTDPGSRLVQAVSAAPDLDGWALVEGLLNDVAALEDQDRLWLVIDDVHELGSAEVLPQLQLLVMRAPPALRFVLATRHNLRLGLHRLRLEGGLAEIRAADLKFTVAEAGELLSAAGVELPAPMLALLHERTEGWAAGLRLAALSLAGHPDPGRLVAEFSGTEQTVAEYLLAEVLDRQSEQGRRLLLRTSVLERVNGELADLLTGDEGAEGVLQDLEQAGAFVVSLDAPRTWFRYHQMFASLLQLELRRTAPGEVTALHTAAAGWLAGHGYATGAIRHAQAARDWDLAARLLADHWPSLHLDGHTGTVHELLADFPPEVAAADAGLGVVTAADELARGSLEAAERYLVQAERALPSVAESRRARVRLLLGVVGLLAARQRGDLPAVAEQASKLQTMAERADTDAVQPGLGEDLRALALISLGITEFWAAAFEDAKRHLEQGVSLARRIGRPYLEFIGLANQAGIDVPRSSFRLAVERARRAVELAERHGWTDEPAAGLAYVVLGAVLAWQMRPEEAEPWAQRAERILNTEAEPAAVLAIRFVRGVLELARGRETDALAAFEAAGQVAGRLTSPHHLLPPTRGLLLHTLVRLGQTERAEQALAGLDDEAREPGEIRVAAAALRLAVNDPHAAIAELAPVLDGSAPVVHAGTGLAHAFILEAIARERLDDPAAADTALERALDVAEPDGVLHPFRLHPVPGLIEEHVRNRSQHAALIAEIRSLLAETSHVSPPTRPESLLEPLSDSELRILRYLPTNLTEPEIARELYVSRNTVKTHRHNLYTKLGTHRRAEAVERARALGLLAPGALGHADRTGAQDAARASS